jgi:hypothetical protein
VVEEVGTDVTRVRPGDVVIAPFVTSDGTCGPCRAGVQTSCVQGGFWAVGSAVGTSADGGQGEAVRVPLADGTLVAVPGGTDDALVPGLLSLSDVMGTGHHAAVSAGVGPGSTVVVVGDGAVGQCAVIAARRLGAEQVVIMSRYPDRQAMARSFGATGVIAERGEAGVALVKEAFGGIGPDVVLECVGTAESMRQAFDGLRPGGAVGFVDAPHGAKAPTRQMFAENKSLRGGIAPVRAYIEELLTDVLSGAIEPGRVFDRTLPLDDVAEGYRAMDARESVKVLLRP